MGVKWAAVILLGATATGTMEAAETGPVDAYTQVEVYVSKGNWPRSVGFPTELASEIFGRIGVHVNWHLGEMPAVPRAGLRCTGIRFVEHAPISATPGALASARPYGSAGSLISVYGDRVHALTARIPSLSDALLAYIFAHELAHVMMGSDYHSGAGVLKAQWSYADYAAMVTRRLSFTDGDSDRIRNGMAVSLAAR
jgi:hypothetical protein